MMLIAQTGLGADIPSPVDGKGLLVAAVTIGLLALAAWALKRHSPMRRAQAAVTVETAVSLGERRSLVIVSVEGRRLLLGLTTAQVTLVTELTAPFAQTLDSTMEKQS